MGLLGNDIVYTRRQVCPNLRPVPPDWTVRRTGQHHSFLPAYAPFFSKRMGTALVQPNYDVQFKRIQALGGTLEFFSEAANVFSGWNVLLTHKRVTTTFPSIVIIIAPMDNFCHPMWAWNEVNHLLVFLLLKFHWIMTLSILGRSKQEALIC